VLLGRIGHSNCLLADLPASIIVTEIARPVAGVDRSSISLAASAAGLTGPAALMRMVRTSSWGWVSSAACSACT
jgi:hypothetical protein